MTHSAKSCAHKTLLIVPLEDEGKLLSNYFKNVNNGPIPSKLAGWQIEKTFPLGKYMDLLCLSLL